MKIYFKDFLKIYFYFFILNINIALAQNVIKQTTDIIKVSNALNPITKRLQLFKKQSYQDKLNNSQDLENLKNFTENKFLKISIENINRPSPLEKKYNQIIKIYKEIIKNQNFITQFGYDIFDKIPKPFISIVDYSKYIIGPKDKLTIYIWNVPEEIYPQKIDLYVNENGKVYLPKIGTLYVAGKSIKDLKKLIKRKLRRYIKNPKIDIFVEIPRQISVILAGEIGKVGTYNLCSLNTLWDALNIAGGIKKSGSLREILLIRSFGKKKKVYIFDLYCLLGVKTFKCLKKLNPKTFYLKDGDIIYVPSIQNTFAIVGEVKKNYIFEYKSRLSLKEAIGKYASYFTPFANLKNIGIIRQYNDGSYGIYKSLSYKDIENSENKIFIKDGDIIVINSNKILDNNTIIVKGPVLNEGYFSLKENTYLSDLLKKTKFTSNTNMEFAVIKNNMRNKIISFSPKQVINNLFDYRLKPYDEVIFFNKYFKKPIIVTGNAIKESKIIKYHNKITLEDVINTINISTESLDDVRIIIKAENAIRIIPYKNLFFNTYKVPPSKIYLKPGTYIYIDKDKHLKRYKVSLLGSVKRAGVYDIDENTTLYDLLKRAGGFKKDAFPQGLVLIRKRVLETQKRYLDITLLKLKLYLQNFIIQNLKYNQNNNNLLSIVNTQIALIDSIKDKEVLGRVLGLKIPKDLEKLKRSKFNIKLEDGDTIYVPTQPHEIFVFGAVRKIGAFFVKEKTRVKDIIKLAGGYLDTARPSEIYIIKPNGTVISSSNLRGWFASIERIYVEPGDAIVVPYKLKIETPILSLLKDITQILYQSAYTLYLIK